MTTRRGSANARLRSVPWRTIFPYAVATAAMAFIAAVAAWPLLP